MLHLKTPQGFTLFDKNFELKKMFGGVCNAHATPAQHLFIFDLFVYLFGDSQLQQRMAEAGASVCLMLAATLFFQTLRFRTEGNFEMDGQRRHLKSVSTTVVYIGMSQLKIIFTG